MGQLILDSMHIVKRKGQNQDFDERKLYASVYAACLSAHEHPEGAEATANLVCREIKNWMKDKDDVTSDQIFEEAARELKHLNKDAALMYQTHRDLS